MDFYKQKKRLMRVATLARKIKLFTGVKRIYGRFVHRIECDCYSQKLSWATLKIMANLKTILMKNYGISDFNARII